MRRGDDADSNHTVTASSYTAESDNFRDIYDDVSLGVLKGDSWYSRSSLP